MPIAKYFKGEGRKVMDRMKETYGDTPKAKSTFYATAKKQGMEPKTKRKSMGQRMANALS